MMNSQRHSSTRLSSVRKPCSTIGIFSAAEYFLRVCRCISFTNFSVCVINGQPQNFTDKGFERLTTEFRTRRSKVASLTYTWLIFAIATGLRPCEWEHARLVDDDGWPQLIVKNTNGRSHGEFRTVYIDELDPSAFETVKAFLGACHLMTEEIGFEKVSSTPIRDFRKIMANQQNPPYPL